MLLRQPASIQHNGRQLWCYGNPKLLDEPLHAVLCSRACPGDKIIEAIDLAQRWRAENRAVISGFHTPVEKECLRIFLRGPQPIVICPARGIYPFLLQAKWQQKFARGELSIISLFDSSVRRPTKETAELRTRLVLSFAQSKTIIYASPHGALSRILAEKPLLQGAS
jgi:predicted Rossmann fold nucleotide-binding protein DprA/Smf involved in DNA uptake